MTNTVGKFWGFLKILNAVLGASALCLSAVLYCAAFGKYIPLPDFLLEKILAYADANGLEVEFSSAGLGADFSVVAENVSVRAHGMPRGFFSAERVCVKPDFRRLFSAPVRRVEIAGASAFPSQNGDALVRDINAAVVLSDGNYRLENLRFKFRNLNVSARGAVEKNFSTADFENIAQILSGYFSAQDNPAPTAKPASAPAAKQPCNAAVLVRDADIALSESAREIDKYSSVLEYPFLTVEFGLLGGGRNFVNVRLDSNKADISAFGVPAQLDEVLASLSYANTKTRERITLSFSAAGAKSGAYSVSAQKLEARAGVNVNAKEVALFDVAASSGRLEYDGTGLDGVAVSKRLLSKTSFADDWYFLLSLGNRRVGGKIDYKDGVVSCNFSGSVNPAPLFGRRELADIPEMRSFDFPQGIDLSGSAEYKLGAAFPKLSASVEAADCEIMGLAIDRVRADVSFADGVLSCPEVDALSKEGWRVRGSYLQSFIDNKYDISVTGRLRPMAIAHFMEPWWTKVMGAFTFKKGAQMPFADVRVEGAWGAPENIWCFGYVRGENALYNGCEFDSFSMNIWVNPARISVYNIDLSAGGGSRKGACAIEWLYGAGGLTSYEKQRLFFESTLDAKELLALGGSDAQSVLDAVSFAAPPRLVLSGVMANESNNPEKMRDVFNAEVWAKDLQVDVIKIENAHFFVATDKILTDIYGADFVFCGGKAEGGVVLEKVGKSIVADGFAKARNMAQDKFFDFLASLGEGGKASEPLFGSDKGGFVTADIKLRGDIENMAFAEGSGNVAIENSEFLKLNLFGAISKAFSAVGLPVGAFDITNVRAELELSSGELKLAPLEISGPSMRVIGATVYVFSDDTVRGELKAYPFDNVRSALVSAVNKVVNPIMDSVRVSVSGTISDPKFSARITPVDIIRSEEKVIERIDGAL